MRPLVLGPHARLFKRVFFGAQKHLIVTFGMEMREWPTRDRATLTATQRRKAVAKSQATQSTQNQSSSTSYILVSTLPEKLRSPAIIPPSSAQSPAGEAGYVGLVSMIISIIQLSGGELSEPRLRRHLTLLNANQMMPSLVPSDRNAANEKTDLVLQRMIKQGYLVKVVDKSAEEGEVITWHIGPRGKVEVDNEAVASIVRAVYGGSSDELEKKLQTSLGVKDRKAELENGDTEMADVGANQDGNEHDAGPSSREQRQNTESRREREDDEDDEEERPAHRRRSGRRRQETEVDEDIYGATPVPRPRRG